MEYDKLKLFQIVAYSASVTEAAKKVLRTQSAVSQQIAQLEKSLGFELFSNKRGRLVLTVEGRELADSLEKPFWQIDEAVCRIERRLDGRVGPIKIGFANRYATAFSLADVLEAFRKKLPEVEVSMCFGSDLEIEEKLKNGVVDFAFIVLFKEKEIFTRLPIARDAHYPMVSAATQSSLGRRGLKSSLSQLSLIDLSDDYTCFRPWLEKNYPESVDELLTSKPSIVVADHSQALDFVKRGWGVAVLPENICDREIRTCEIVPLAAKAKALTVELDVAYLSAKNLSVVENEFLASVSELV